MKTPHKEGCLIIGLHRDVIENLNSNTFLTVGFHKHLEYMFHVSVVESVIGPRAVQIPQGKRIIVVRCEASMHFEASTRSEHPPAVDIGRESREDRRCCYLAQ